MSHETDAQGQPKAPTRPARAYRELMKKVEAAVEAIQGGDDVATTIRSVIERVIREFRGELGIFGGRLYRRTGEVYTIQATFGEAKELPAGLTVPRSYPPLDRCRMQGTIYIDADDPTVDHAFEESLGVREFACVEVGEEEFILAFNVAAGSNREDILVSLGILRHAINQKIRHRRLQEVFQQAREIQTSIMPKRVPRHGDFDIYGRSEALESVGGDYHDYLPLSDKILGIAIADVSGHGLPAALQVRDIYTGLRMGMARDFKIVRTIEHLNRLIHGSTLTSRFVSLFYGELETDGLFLYVNAGHPRPFHLRADGSHQLLAAGGAVLGPIADAAYERGIARLAPGDMLVLYTDGITETRGRNPETGKVEELGTERLLEMARRHQGRSAAEIVDALFQDVERFGGGQQVQDDRTLVVVTRPGKAVRR